MKGNRKQRREAEKLEKVAPPLSNLSREEAKVVELELIAARAKLVPQSNAGECNNCPALRAKKQIPNSTRIYAKRGVVRYCICNVCKSTWKRVF